MSNVSVELYDNLPWFRSPLVKEKPLESWNNCSTDGTIEAETTIVLLVNCNFVLFSSIYDQMLVALLVYVRYVLTLFNLIRRSNNLKRECSNFAFASCSRIYHSIVLYTLRVGTAALWDIFLAAPLHFSSLAWTS